MNNLQRLSELVRREGDSDDAKALAEITQQLAVPAARSKSQLRRFQVLGAHQFKCEFCGTVVDVATVLRP